MQNTNRKITTIVFDLDGTLLDTLEDLTNATNAALHYSGFAYRSMEEVRRFVGNGVQKLMERAVPEGTDPAEFEMTFGYFKDYYEMHCLDKTRPYEGTLEMLQQLKDKGYKMAIVSNKLDSAVKELRDRFFKDNLSVAVGDQEGLRRKPYPDMVEEALKQLGETKEHAVYVGDSDVDLQTAQNSGLPCISVLWGFRDEEELREAGAEHFAQTPEEVISLVENMQK